MGALQAAQWAQQSFAAQAAPMAFGIQAPLQVAQMLPGGQPVIWGQANLFHSPATGQQQWAFVPAQTVGMGPHPIPAAVLQGLVPIAAMRPHSCEPPDTSSAVTSPRHFVDSTPRHGTSKGDLSEDSLGVTTVQVTAVQQAAADPAQPFRKQEVDICCGDLDISQMSLTTGSTISPSTTDSCEFLTFIYLTVNARGKQPQIRVCLYDIKGYFTYLNKNYLCTHFKHSQIILD